MSSRVKPSSITSSVPPKPQPSSSNRVSVCQYEHGAGSDVLTDSNLDALSKLNRLPIAPQAGAPIFHYSAAVDNVSTVGGSSSVGAPAIRSSGGVAKMVSFNGEVFNATLWERLGIVGQLINPDSKTLAGRRIQMMQVLFFALVAFAGVLVQVYTDADHGSIRSSKVADISRPFKVIADMYELMHTLREEAYIFFLYTSDSYDDFLTKAQTAIRNTDTTLLWIEVWPQPEHFELVPENLRVNISSSTTLSTALRNQRNLRKTDNATTEIDHILFYFGMIDSLTLVTNSVIMKMARFQGWAELLASQHLLEMETGAQLVHAIGQKFLKEKRVTPLDDFIYQRLFSARIMYEEMLELAQQSSRFSKNELRTNYTQQEVVKTFTSLYQLVVAFEYADQTLTTSAFEESFAKTQAAINWFQSTTLTRVNQAVQYDIKNWKESEIVSIVLLVVSAVICFGAIFVHYQGLHLLQSQIIDSNKRADLLDKAMIMLYDFVPRFLVNSVLQGETLAPRRAPDLAVVMVDINTSALMEDFEPNDFMDLLAEYYMAMEDTVKKFNCFKLDVIGDAFCLGAGAGEPHGIDHVTEMVFMALEMQTRASEIQVKEGAEDALRLRVGIHVGPGVSHVLHLQVPRMCLFGDCIETASLIHATSLPLRVQTSSAVYERLINCPDIEFNRRGTLILPSSKEIAVYWAAWADDDDPAIDDDRQSTPSLKNEPRRSDGGGLKGPVLTDVSTIASTLPTGGSNFEMGPPPATPLTSVTTGTTRALHGSAEGPDMAMLDTHDLEVDRTEDNSSLADSITF